MIDINAIRRAVDPRYKSGNDVRCPVHEDSTASLSINVKDDKLLCYCHAGCDQRAVWEAVTTAAKPWLNGHADDPGELYRTIYEYRSADGKVLVRVYRKDLANGEKRFTQRTPDGNGGWQWKGPAGETPLFHLPELAASPNLPVVITEGEKACLAAQKLLGSSYVATCWMGGADKVRRADLGPLKNRDVIVWPDADDAGKKAAEELVARLRGIAGRVRTVRVDDLPKKADAADVKWSVAEFEQRLLEKAEGGMLRSRKLTDFLLDSVVIEYVADDFLVRGWLYTLTGSTGAGKTGVGAVLQLAVATGRAFGPYQCNAGPGLYVAGENAADVHNRFLVAIQQMEMSTPQNIEVIDQSFLLAERIDELLAIVERLKPALIIVDTDQAVALAGSTEENSNAERMAHAKLLRRLTRASSRPTVLDLCHPIKNADKDNLVPRGGSAFLNEVDGNLRLWRDGDAVELVSDPNKFRGAPVAVSFRIEPVQSCSIKDAKGRLISIPYIAPISDDEASRIVKEQWQEENLLVYQMQLNPKGTQVDWAQACGWVSDVGKPRKDKVNRLLKKLEKCKPALVQQARSGRWRLTTAGETEARKGS